VRSFVAAWSQVRVRWCSSAVNSKLIHLVLLFTGPFPLCVFITTVPSCHPFVSLRLLHHQSSSLSSAQSHLSFVHRRAQPADWSPAGSVLLCRRQSACLVTKLDRRRKQGHRSLVVRCSNFSQTLVLLGASCIDTPSSPSFPHHHPRRQHPPTLRVAAVVDHCASHKSCAGSVHGRTARFLLLLLIHSNLPPSSFSMSASRFIALFTCIGAVLSSACHPGRGRTSPSNPRRHPAG